MSRYFNRSVALKCVAISEYCKRSSGTLFVSIILSIDAVLCLGFLVLYPKGKVNDSPGLFHPSNKLPNLTVEIYFYIIEIRRMC